jgi:erythromycin esterase
MRMRAEPSGGTRDECMAENVAWILERNPGARIVLWAHNSHVSRAKPWMGSHLAERFGAEYLPVAFAAGRGEYFAKQPGEGGAGELGVHPLAEPPPGSVESAFEAIGAERAILDLRASEPGSPASGWLHEERPFRSLGALATERQFWPRNLARGWDVLIWFAETEAARQMDTPRPERE